MTYRVGIVGLGDMGSGLAKNLIEHGFETAGFDLSGPRMEEFTKMGGKGASSAAEVGSGAKAVFVMVLNGNQANAVVFGEDGLASAMSPGSTILMTATIKPVEVREIASKLESTGIRLIDTPVSGGYSGAQDGSLTLMTAAANDVLEDNREILEAVSGTLHHVGTEAGMGQTVKACLQSLIGSIFTASFEATVLAAKAGVDADALYKVFSNSGAGCAVSNTAVKNIIAGEFEDTGSHINTMYKDMTIAMDLARDLGVPMFTAASAMQLFQAGKTKFPNGDNWVVTRLTEEIVGAKLRQKGKNQ